MQINLPNKLTFENSCKNVDNKESFQRPPEIGGYWNHIFRLKKVIDNMTNRGLPIKERRLKAYKRLLQRHAKLTRAKIAAHLERVSVEKGHVFHGWHPSSEGYKTLPEDLREFTRERHYITTQIVSRRKKTLVDGKNKLLPTDVEEPIAKYPTHITNYQLWFIDKVAELGYEFIPLLMSGPGVGIEVAAVIKRVQFNPNSRDQLEKYCDVMGYKIPLVTKKTEHGRELKASLDDKAIQKLGRLTSDPIFPLVEEMREIEKLITTYCDDWMPNGEDGRLHSTFMLNSGTGQSRSRNPNVQNAPSHSGEYGKKFKSIVKARPGRVILNCVAPGTKVLMRDLTWKNAEDITTADQLLGFDEFPVEPTSRRYFRTSFVRGTQIQQSKKIKVVTTQGEIIVSPDHKFLKRTAGRAVWVEARKLGQGHKIRFFTKPWEVLRDFDAGWLSGFLDGEGYVGNGGGNQWTGNKCTGLGFGQNPGAVLDRALDIVAKLGYEVSKSSAKTGQKRTCEQYHILSRKSGMPYAWARLLGQVRPIRLLSKVLLTLEGLATWGTASIAAEILSVESIDDGPVVAISTSTKTLITNGFLSHNCDYTGYHALMLGYFAESLEYMRLSKLGVHDFFAAQMLRGNGKLDEATADHLKDFSLWLTYDDATLSSKLKWIKKNHKHLRDKKAKPITHSIGFGAQANGIYEKNEEAFSSKREVETLRDLYFRTFPMIAKFQDKICKQAYEDRKIVSPYGYVRRFYEAMVYKGGNLERGEQASEAIAFLPANTAFSVKKECMLRLEAMGANEKYGFFNEVHDSLMYEPLEKDVDEAIRVIAREMTAPVKLLAHERLCPDGLSCDVEISIGDSWASLEEIKL